MMNSKLLCQGNRAEAIMALLDGPKQASALPGSNTQNKIATVRPLIAPGMVRVTGHLYSLTDVGKTYALFMKAFADMEEVFKDPFWQTHDLGSIPDHLKIKIGMLKGGGVVYPNHNVSKAQDNFIDLLTHAKRIHGASSFNLAGYSEMITEALANGAEIDLILAPAVIQSLSPADINAWQATGRFRLHIKEVKAALAVADNTLSIGLFDEAGVYDPTQDFICRSEDAAEWGRELFHYYLSK